MLDRSSKIIFHLLLFLFLYACKNNINTSLLPQPVNLFIDKENIPSISLSNTQKNTLTPDSALQKSTLAAICSLISIDSFVQNNKAVFYINTVKPTRILKGVYSNNQNINFISNTLFSFALNDSGYIVYLEPIQQKKLITQNYIQWQWLTNAPYQKSYAKF